MSKYKKTKSTLVSYTNGMPQDKRALDDYSKGYSANLEASEGTRYQTAVSRILSKYP